MSLAVSLRFLVSEFSVYIMWICKCSSFAFLLLCRKSHKTPLWISLWHIHIMWEWESCINNSIKSTTRIIQWNPSAITAAICGGLPNPSVGHLKPLLNTQTMLGSISGTAMVPSWYPNQVPSRTLMPKSHHPETFGKPLVRGISMKSLVERLGDSMFCPHINACSQLPACSVQQSSEGNALILITCWSHQDCVLSWAGVFMSQILFLVIRRPGNTLDGAFDSK